MDIRGLVLVNSASVGLVERHQFAGFAPALTDVAGKSPLQRIAERLQAFGASPVTAVVNGQQYNTGAKSSGNISQIFTSAERFWRSAESAFNDLVQSGAELVILVSLGPYAEIDFESMVQFHLDRQCRVSRATQNGQPVEVFCISASRRNDAASLFRSKLTHCRTDCPEFENFGYLNHLAGPLDLRQFAIDILTLKTETAPAGEQIRPGVWAASRAQIEKGARILAPAFIGSFARIRSGAVITRCSSIEQRAQVDCGTIVENSSLLPHSYIGAGLELAHSLAGFSCIWNLRRDCAVRITDSKLLRHSVASSRNRMLSSTAELISYLPRQFWRGIFGPSPAPNPDLNHALRQNSPSLGAASGYRAPACDSQAANEFPSNFVVARTHGNQ